MEKIEFYILNTEPNDNAIKYHKMFRNSMLSFKNGKIYFNSDFTGKEEIEYSYRILDIDEQILRDVHIILEYSYNEAKTISLENMGIENIEGSVLGGIKDVLNRYMFYSKGEKDIFDLFTDIFVRILMGHYLTNGNKRLALTFLKGILWHFGYYLKWTEGMCKNYTNHKTQVETFVEKMQGKTGEEKTVILSGNYHLIVSRNI